MTSSLSLKSLRVISLTVLLLQNATQSILLRYLRTRQVPLFYSSTAVCMAEVFKLILCSISLLVCVRFDVRHFASCLREECFLQWRETAKSAGVALLYIVQNNLHYVAVSNLEVAILQVAYQLKLLTTAFFGFIILGRKLTHLQTASLLILFIGICFVQWPPATHPISFRFLVSAYFFNITATDPQDSPVAPADSEAPTNSSLISVIIKDASLPYFQSSVIGLGAVLISCIISGFAAVYFEKMLKQQAQSIIMRNIQLSAAGIVFSLTGCLFYDGGIIYRTSFFHGYDALVWLLIILIAIGGICIAVVIKYTDSIVKGYATSGAIVLGTLASIFFFQFQLTPIFCLGTLLVLIAIYSYGIS